MLEYDEVLSREEDLKHWMNTRAAKGWRLHSVVVVVAGRTYMLIFEREVKSDGQ